MDKKDLKILAVYDFFTAKLIDDFNNRVSTIIEIGIPEFYFSSPATLVIEEQFIKDVPIEPCI